MPKCLHHPKEPQALDLWPWLILLSLLAIGPFASADRNSKGNTDWYQPTAGTDWQWQLQGPINSTHAATIYDIDLFTTPTDTIQALHKQGRKLICYFSAGSWEPERPDQDRFPPSAIGKAMADWPDEHWLDIRSKPVRKALLARLDLAQQKGCDGVEPDNVDAYTQDSGFALTPTDQLDFNRFLARAAHHRGLAVGLKNDLDQVADLVDEFDFAVNEQCFEYRECQMLEAFIKAGKAVLNAEYAELYVNSRKARSAICRRSRSIGLSSLVLPLSLDDSFRFSCSRGR